MSTVRTFIALEMSGEVTQALGRLVRRLKKLSSWSLGSQVRWVDAKGFHLTLCFLGEVDWTRTQEICRVAGPIIAKRSPFLISCRGLGVFPNWQAPRVVWAGVEEPDGPPQELSEAAVERLGTAAECPVLTNLQRELRQALLDRRFFPDTKPFHPHVTLGRVSAAARGQASSSPLPAGILEEEFGQIWVERLKLMSSERNRDGAIYHSLATLELGKPG